MNRTIWILRHALSEDSVHPDWVKNADRPWDPPLAKEGFSQAEKVAKRLKTANIDHLFSSPFLRALQTSDCVGKALGIPVIVDTGLGEWGTAQTNIPKDASLNRDEIASMFPGIHSFRVSAVPSYPIESEWELCVRMRSTIQSILKSVPEGNVLLVSHASPIIILLRYLDESFFVQFYGPLENPLSQLSEKVPVCSLSKVIERKNHWVLEEIGTQVH